MSKGGHFESGCQKPFDIAGDAALVSKVTAPTIFSQLGSAKAKKTAALVFLVLALAARVYFALATQMFIVPDEYAHWNYTKFIRENHSLPDFAQPHAANRNTPERHSYENYQQPGYYALASVFSFGSPRVCRLFSVAVFMVGLIFLYRAFPRPWLIGVFSLLPGVVFISSIISNDGLMVVSVCILVWALKRKNTIGYIVACLLLAFAKFHGLVILGALVAYLLIWRRNERTWLYALIILALGMIAYIDRYPLSKINGMAWQGASPTVLFNMLRDTAYSFLISPETAGAQPWLYAVTIIVGLAIAVFSVIALIRQPLSVYAVVAYAGIFVFLAFTFTHVHYQGRLLYPVVPALIANWAPKAGEKKPKQKTPRPKSG